MIVIGSFTLGLLAGTALGFFFQMRTKTGEELIGLGPQFFRKPQKKRPVSVSEEEQWKREQKQVPLDPGL